jgi:type IV pilus assembly protein PilE
MERRPRAGAGRSRPAGGARRRPVARAAAGATGRHAAAIPTSTSGDNVMSRKARGFTLIEMMVVVAIVAILAAIAYPSYSKYAYRTRRADGKELLMRFAAAQERYYTSMNRYATADQLGMDTTSEKQYYTVNVRLGNGNQTYVLQATPQGPQLNDSCGMLTLDNTGYKNAPADDHSNGDCW